MPIKVKGLQGFENNPWFHHYKLAIEMQAEKVLKCLGEYGFATGGTSFWYLQNCPQGNVRLYKGIKNYGYVNACEVCESSLDAVVLSLVDLLNHLSKDTNINWNYFVFKNNTSFYNGSFLLSVNVLGTSDDIVMKYVLDKSSIVLYNSHKVGIQLKNIGNFENKFPGNTINSSIAVFLKTYVLRGYSIDRVVRENNQLFNIKSIEISGGNDDYEVYTCKNLKGETMYLRIGY